jgi:putative salt-induced outer membrane protein YdiY
MRRVLLIFSLLLTTTRVSADELRLANGDRYTGEVVSLDAGKLRFKTTHGNLEIPWSDVTSLTVDAPVLVRVDPTAAPTSMTGPIQTAGVIALSRPTPPLVVTGGANAGLLTTGGNTEIGSLRVDADVTARASANRYTFGGAVNRAKDRDLETARNWTFAARYDRFLTTRLFVGGDAILTNDRFRALDLRTAVGAGVGYQIADTPVVKLSADGGLGYVNENFESAPDDSYGAVREAVKLDVFVVGNRAVLFHRQDGYFGVTGEDNRFVRMQNGVRFGLVGGLVTTAQLDLDYDASPAPGRRSTDRTFALTFGYRF